MPTPRDPGLQVERTALAWSRTGLAVLVNALLALRSGWVTGEVSITFLGVALLLSAAVVALCGTRRGRHLASDGGAVSAPGSIVAGVAAVALLACAAALASISVAVFRLG